MANTGFSAFDTMAQKAVIWLDEIGQAIGRDDRETAYKAMRAVLHTLRDRLPVQEAVHLSAELPAFVRGIYFESYTPENVPTRERRSQEFLNTVGRHLGDLRGDDIPPQQATDAVLTVLSGHISTGHVTKVIQMFPEEMRSLWPESIVEEATA